MLSNIVLIATITIGFVVVFGVVLAVANFITKLITKGL